VVVLRPDISAEDAFSAIRSGIAAAIAAGKLPKWAAPDQIVTLDSLPKTSVGKLDKKRMRAELAARFG
jgi:fatty-acyl-CoA synthase